MQFFGCKANRPRRIERLGFDGVAKTHPRALVRGIGLEKLVRKIAQGQNRLIDSMESKVTKNAFEHGNAHNREHLFGLARGQGPQTRAFPAHQDDRLHERYFFVVVVVGAVVVGTVVVGTVVVGAETVGKVVAPPLTAVVGVVEVWPAWSMAEIVVAGGRGTFAPLGKKEIVTREFAVRWNALVELLVCGLVDAKLDQKV